MFDDLVSTDEEGKTLPNPQAANVEAVREVRQIACAEVTEGHLHLNHRIEIADDSGEIIDTVWFRDAVEVEG